MFISISHPWVRALSSKSTGENLPTDYAPWRPCGTGALSIGHMSSSIAAAIRADGFFLISEKPTGP